MNVEKMCKPVVGHCCYYCRYYANQSFDHRLLFDSNANFYCFVRAVPLSELHFYDDVVRESVVVELVFVAHNR